MRRLVLLLFFLSGACGLVYEVVWARLLTHVFGSTALAVGTVLAAFMAGLALGAWGIGRWADRSADPLRLYAKLELGVGVAALLAHVLLGRIAPVYVGVYELFGRSEAALGAARFVLAFGLVLVPTVLMGATLPVLARFVVSRLASLGTDLSTLYAINTLGAVAGTLGAGFFLIGALGIHGAVLVAAAGNLAVGVIAWQAARRRTAGGAATAAASAPEPAPVTAGGANPGVKTLVLAGLAISGLTSFAYEVLWTRSLVFLLGNSTYAVTTMLTAFLLGIALGGYIVRFVMERVASRAALFAWIQLAIAVSAATALPLLFAYADPQALRVRLGHASMERLLWLRFGVALGVMLVPATLVGTTFPLAARIVVADLRRTGSVVGRVYALNTLGNVLGALLPGLALLSWLGIQRGIVAMAALNAAVGVGLLFMLLPRSRSLRWALPVGAFGAAVVLLSAPIDFQFPAESQTSDHRVLFYREGPLATTMVLVDKEKGERSMCVDGIEIGGNTFTEYKQLLLAHLPKLLVDDVSPELSIGLGSGMLVGESARHSQVEHITCVEIEPSVVDGANLFQRENHDVLRERRMELVIDDVANHLRTTDERYAVVSADEKTAQDYASNGFSYSREYYELLRERLAPGGIVVQWVPTTLPPAQYAMILATFAASFPRMQLWYFPPGYKEGASNTILVGSLERVAPDLTAMRRRWEASGEAFASLVPYGLTSPEAFLVHFVAEEDAIREAVGHAPENTLARPRYEFFSPADYAVPRNDRLAVNHAFLVRLKRASAPAFLEEAAAAEEADVALLMEGLAAETEFLTALGEAVSGRPTQATLARYDAALELAPWNDGLRARVFLQFWEAGMAQAGQGDNRFAAQLMGRALEVAGQSAMAHVVYAGVLGLLGESEHALQEARVGAGLDPRLVAARRLLAHFLIEAGHEEEAAAELRALIALDPEDEAAREVLESLESEDHAEHG